MGRTRTWYDPSAQDVVLRAAYVRRQEYVRGASPAESSRRLVGYWSPVSGVLWTADQLREAWASNLEDVGLDQFVTGDELAHPSPWWVRQYWSRRFREQFR